MKKLLLLFFFLTILLSINAQNGKLITEIKSLHTNETISFKYNSKNQLIYFDEKGVITYREFSLKYDKKTDRLTEFTINQDRGEYVANMKYTYDNPDYIVQEISTSRKKVKANATEHDNIYTDDKGRLLKTSFDGGQPWERFVYDNNNNLTLYTVYTVSGKKEQESEYTYDNKRSIFSGIKNLPLWFWTLCMNNMRWCSEFTGSNNAVETNSESNKYGISTVEITYDYDADGYPVRQYYDGELAKEFKYK